MKKIITLSMVAVFMFLNAGLANASFWSETDKALTKTTNAVNTAKKVDSSVKEAKSADAKAKRKAAQAEAKKNAKAKAKSTAKQKTDKLINKVFD